VLLIDDGYWLFIREVHVHRVEKLMRYCISGLA
jgi:hypothetical protein